MKVHRCYRRGCTRIIPFSQSYCPIHQAEVDQQHEEYLERLNWIQHNTLNGKAKAQQANQQYDNTTRKELHDGFYNSPAWRQVAQYVRNRDGWTSAVSNTVQDELVADHIIPRRLQPKEDQLNPDNIWLLTKREHNIKTDIESTIPEPTLLLMTKEDWIPLIKNRLKEPK